jgi:ABC-type phosphate transport system substrate-binding protein
MSRINNLVGPCALLAISMLMLAIPLPAQDDPIAVVVSKENPVNNLSLADLRRIFLGEQLFWKGRLAVTPLMRANAAREREVAMRTLFQMNEQEYKRHWVDKVFRGEASAPPAEVFSNGFAQDAVANNRGAVALVSWKEVRSKVKVLKVDGHLPGEEGYPLR